MNILIYSPTITYPLNAGNKIRIYTLAEYIKSLGHEVHFLYFSNEKIDLKTYAELEKNWDSTTIIKQQNLHHHLFSKNVPLDEAYEDGLGEKVAEVCEVLNIDALICNYIFQSKLFNYIPNNIVKIIDTHDKFTDKYKIAKWYSFDQENEALGLSRADLILAIQQNEADYFSTITNKPVNVISHITHHNFINYNRNQCEKIGIISSGHYQDLIAIEKFLDIVEEIEEKQFSIYLAGTICSKLNKEYTSVIKMGFLSDIKTFYQEVDLVLSLPLNGTGLKIKTVEALSYGLPLISTSVGFEGISNGKDYHNFNNFEKLIQYIDHVTHNPSLLKKMSEDSRSIFEQYHQNVSTSIDSLLDQILHLVNDKKMINDNHGKVVEFYQKYQRLKQRLNTEDYLMLQEKLNTCQMNLQQSNENIKKLVTSKRWKIASKIASIIKM